MDNTALSLTDREILGVLNLLPSAVAVYATEDIIIQSANKAMLALWGKTDHVIGLPIAIALPELEGQPFVGLLKEVWQTGNSYEAIDTPATLNINGTNKLFFFDFIYRAIKNKHGDVFCILHTAEDVTERNLGNQAIEKARLSEAALEREQTLNVELGAANEALSSTNEALLLAQKNLANLNNELEAKVLERTQNLAESEARLRYMLADAPVAIALLTGKDMLIEAANKKILEAWGKTPDVIGKPLSIALPELAEQDFLQVLDQVYTSGEPFYGNEVKALIEQNGRTETIYANFVYHPLKTEHGQTSSIILVANMVTDQVMARKQVEASEHRLRSMVMTAPIGMTVLRGRELIIEMANQPILDIWGRPLEAVQGKELMSIFPELEGQPFPAMLAEVFHTGKAVALPEIEVDVMTPGGNMHYYVDFSYDPLFDTNGAVEAILATVINITETVLARKKLEKSEEEQQALNEELLASNEELAAANEELAATQEDLQKIVEELAASDSRFRFLVQEAPVAIGVLSTRELLIESANDMMLKVWGKTNNVIGRKLADALPELQGQPFLQILDDVYTSGKAYHGNEAKVYLDYDGEMKERYFNFIYQPLKQEKGITNTIMVVAHDVTDQVRAKRVTEESEKQFRGLLNTIPQQVWTSLPDGQLDYVNQVVCDDFGYSTAEIVGHGWRMFIHPDDLHYCLKKWSHALETGQEYMVEFRLKFHDGSYKWHLGRALPLVEDGKIKLWLGTNTNIEVQKENEQKKDEFLSIASHELKTPLTSIKAYNQLSQRIKETEVLKPFLKKSEEHIDRLERLINDLLDVTKINAGKMTYTMEPFAFHNMIAESVETVRHLTAAHEIILEENAEIQYTGDHFRLEQVLNNFISNAIKYSPGGEKIIIRSAVSHDNIVVSVQDFGIGIEEKNLDKLFDRYYRVDNTAMRFEGLGLGLFITSEILKGHQGSFWIESEPGKGSTFYFRLPLESVPAKPAFTQTDTFYQDSFITVSYNAQHERMDVDWTGFQDFDSVKRGGAIMLEMLTKNACHKVLNDNTNVLGSWSEAADWAGTEWFPMMEKAGLKYFAWIYSPSMFSRLAAKKSVDIAMGSVVTQFFTETTVAAEWLEKQP